MKHIFFVLVLIVAAQLLNAVQEHENMACEYVLSPFGSANNSESEMTYIYVCKPPAHNEENIIELKYAEEEPGEPNGEEFEFGEDPGDPDCCERGPRISPTRVFRNLRKSK